MSKPTTRSGSAALAIAGTVLALGLAALAGAAPAAAAPSLKLVRYHGLRLEVPRGWPVLRLGPSSHTCVRFDRHAVYLGVPGRDELCPPQAAGRTEAILVQPLASATPVLPAVSAARDDAPGGSSARLVDRRHGVVVTVTWGRAPGAVARALGRRSLAAAARASRGRPSASPTARRRVRTASAPAMLRQARVARGAAITGAPAEPGQVYTGPGFDTCSTPSSAAMAAWASSPYRGIGVYIGGADMACSQPNLTAAWVSQQSAAGWHLVPIYVGLQAPANSCGCHAFSAGTAAAQGSAAADDAVAHVQALGIGTGNPVYFDMEAYSRTSANTSAVLTFLQAWTTELHAQGYQSGVYSSAGSGIRDLVAQAGTGYPEPDDIWIADWNNQATTADASVPPEYFSQHQRLHQYTGDSKETYGGATIDLDHDYLDSATAAAGTGTGATVAPPTSTAPPSVTGAPLAGQTLTEGHGRWTGRPTSYGYQWEDCDPTGTTCTPIAGATGQTYTLAAADAGSRIRVLETAANAGGAGSPAVSPATAAVQSAPSSGYWRFTAYGNVFNSPGAAFFGSPAARRLHASTITGMAGTRDGRGYWLAESTGGVLTYGDATRLPAIRPPHPIIGITGDPAGRGYWLFTAYGNVLNRGARFRGSPAWAHVHTSAIRGMAPTRDGRGYWLATSGGQVYHYGDAANVGGRRLPHPVVGIVANPAGSGVWLFTAYGNVFNLGGAPWFGSPSRARRSDITGMTATPDGGGYWLSTAGGQVLPFGDAATFPQPHVPHPVVGIAGS